MIQEVTVGAKQARTNSCQVCMVLFVALICLLSSTCGIEQELSFVMDGDTVPWRTFLTSALYCVRVPANQVLTSVASDSVDTL